MELGVEARHQPPIPSDLCDGNKRNQSPTQEEECRIILIADEVAEDGTNRLEMHISN